MASIDLKIINEFIKNNSTRVVEELNFEKKTIKYSNKIKQHRIIDKITGDEEVVRAYLLTKLVNKLGYKENFIEIEKGYDLGRPKVIKPRIDIIVKDKEENPFLYIELKSPEEFEKDQDELIEKQLYNLASQELGAGKKVKYLILYSFDIINEEIRDKSIIIDYEQFPTFDKWKEIRNFTDTLPKKYGKVQKQPFIKNGLKDLENNYTHYELDIIKKNLHNVLWGGGGTDDNDVFSSLVNIILAKIQDESEKKKWRKYDFQIFSFKDGETFESNEELFERINGLYIKALKQRLNIIDENRLKKSYVIDENKFSLSKLKYTVSQLEKYSFVDGKNSLQGKDVLGDFFEGIIREGFKQTKGQFFTHINIVRFMLWSLQLEKLAINKVNNELELPYVIDPSVGSGTFLIEYMKFLTDSLKRRFNNKLNQTRDIEDKFHNWFLPENRENKWAKDYLYGSEHNFNLGTATKVNMILHGDGASNIFVKDGLLPFQHYKNNNSNNILNTSVESEDYFSYKTNSKFDVILSNPPFSVKLDNETKKNLKTSFIFGGKKNSENLFIERYYQLLKENGRMGIVLPDSVLDTTENKYIRLFIYKYFKIKSVVSLPQITFQPFTSTKTSLLFAQKKTSDEINEWNKIWLEFSNEWSKLKTRCENLIKVYKDGNKKNKFPSLKGTSKSDERKILINFLHIYSDEINVNLSSEEIVNEYESELLNLCSIDKDTKDVFGFVNCWWVFNKVSNKMNYKILMSEASQIGYKRSKRGQKTTSNDLYRTDKNGQILIDDGITKTILDQLRQIEWD